jgi:hypothetical protein
MRNIYALTLLLAFCATSAFGQTPYYTVKFPDDITIYSCGVVPVSSYPTITQTGTGCNFNVGVNQHDQVFYTGGGTTCAKILRTWTLIWWCDYDPNTSVPTYVMNPGNSDTGPTVQGNSANHGYLKYTQIIKILDNVPPVFLNCPTEAVTFCDDTNNDPAQYNQWGQDRCEGPVNLTIQVTDACAKANIALSYRLFLDLDGNGSMETFISSSSAGAWPIETSVSGDVLTGRIKFPANYGLPYGSHKVEWIASDNCAGQSICKYDFRVKDCKPPTVVCLNGLSVNIMPTGMITFWATDFLHYAFDNCTPANQLKIGIRKAGTGTGFPTNPDGTPMTGVTFTCAEIGTNFVEIWAQDAYGNAGYCTTYLIVQDHFGACPPPPSIPNNMKGTVATSLSKNIKGVDVQAKNPSQAMLCKTDSAGIYSVSNMATCDLTLTPAHNVNVKQGVTMHDLTLLAYHYAGLDTITDPYTLLAADVNRDGQITDMDLSGVLGVALGIDTAFVNNTSWRFVPKTFVFPANVPVLSVAVPEKISLVSPGCMQPKGDFIGIKVGDLNQSALNPAADQAKSPENALFSVQSTEFEAGEIVKIAVESPELSAVSDFQFQLGVDGKTLRIIGIEPGFIPANQVHQDAVNGRINAGWSAAINGGKSKKGAAFVLVCQALRAGNSATALTLEQDGPIAAELFLNNGSRQPIALDGIAAAQIARVHPITPNPAKGLVTVRFDLPEAGTATLSARSATGGLLYSFTGDFAKGTNTQVFDLAHQNVTGLVFVRLESATGISTQQLVLER